MAMDHPCSKCNRVFKREFDLTRHVDAVHDKIRYTCKGCMKKFSRVASLKHHERAGNCKLKLGDADIISIIPLKDYVTQDFSFTPATNPFNNQKRDNITNTSRKASATKHSDTIVRPHPVKLTPVKRCKRESNCERLSVSSEAESNLCKVVHTPATNYISFKDRVEASTSKSSPPTRKWYLPNKPDISDNTLKAEDSVINLITPYLSSASTMTATDSGSNDWGAGGTGGQFM